MHLLYNLSIRLFYLGVFLAQGFNPKAKKWILGRKKIWETLPKLPENRPVYWFHCASLGEFDQGLPLMNKLKEQQANVFLVVTFFSPSGFENYHKRQHPADFVCYLPLDTPQNAKRFVQHFQPKAAFFVKYEFWSNCIFALKAQGSKIYSVCTIFRPEHRFFKWYGGFFRKTLRQFDCFFVQNKTSVSLMHSIGIMQVELVGDMRFDRVLEHKQQVKADEVVEQFLAGDQAFIIGSSWSVDEQFLKEAVLDFIRNGKIIIAPHQIDEAHLSEIETIFGTQLVRYSHYSPQTTSARILLIDSIGKLANLYQYGKFAYIGGGFTGSLHNILEPAVFGLPVLFGPKHNRFPEAQLFIDEGVGFSISEKKQIQETISQIEANREILNGKLAALVQSQAGASDLILEKLKFVF